MRAKRAQAAVGLVRLRPAVSPLTITESASSRWHEPQKEGGVVIAFWKTVSLTPRTTLLRIVAWLTPFSNRRFGKLEQLNLA